MEEQNSHSSRIGTVQTAEVLCSLAWKPRVFRHSSAPADRRTLEVGGVPPPQAI